MPFLPVDQLTAAQIAAVCEAADKHSRGRALALLSLFGCEPSEASVEQAARALAMSRPQTPPVDVSIVLEEDR